MLGIEENCKNSFIYVCHYFYKGRCMKLWCAQYMFVSVLMILSISCVFVSVQLDVATVRTDSITVIQSLRFVKGQVKISLYTLWWHIGRAEA